MNQSIYLREANIDDLELLNYWDEKEHVIESDPNDDWNWEVELKKFPSWRKQFIAMKNQEPIGFIQIIDPKLEIFGLEKKKI
jgi:aminoglycoside 6'-N-acetyltransferase